MLEFPEGRTDPEFWDQFSDDPMIFDVQVRLGISYVIAPPDLPEGKFAESYNGVSLDVLRSLHPHWKMFPKYYPEMYGENVAKGLELYDSDVAENGKKAQALTERYQKQLVGDPPTTPVGYYWHEIRPCLKSDEVLSFQLWKVEYGYSPIC